MVNYFGKSDRLTAKYASLLSSENQCLVLILRQTLKDHANAVNQDGSNDIQYDFPEEELDD